MNVLNDIKLLLATIYRDTSNARHQLATLFKPGEESDLSSAYDSLGVMLDELEVVYSHVFPGGSLDSEWLTILNKEQKL